MSRGKFNPLNFFFPEYLIPAEEGEDDQDDAGKPAAEAEDGGAVKAESGAGEDQKGGQNVEHPHAVEGNEGQVVGADDDHGGGEEPVFPIEGGGADQQEVDGDGEGGLGAQVPQSIRRADLSRAAQQADQALGQGKDEHAAEEEQGHAVAWSDPQAYGRGEQPDKAGDELPGEAAQKGGTHFTLRIDDGHLGSWLRG